MATIWEEEIESADTLETHWSAGTIMALFMAASLVSAVFFGLGYSFGRGGTAKPALRAAAIQPAESAASPAQEPLVATAPRPALREVASVSSPSLPSTSRSTEQSALLTSPALRPAVVAPVQHATTSPARPRPLARQFERARPTRKAAEPQTSSASHYMVQVGAVADRSDARTLVSQLRHRGFHAGIYPAKHDRFLHVQIGPFANEQQAQTMRHHVMASGYRAILKRAS